MHDYAVLFDGVNHMWNDVVMSYFLFECCMLYVAHAYAFWWWLIPIVWNWTCRANTRTQWFSGGEAGFVSPWCMGESLFNVVSEAETEQRVNLVHVWYHMHRVLHCIWIIT